MELDKEKVSFTAIENKNFTLNINTNEIAEENIKLLSVSAYGTVGRSEIVGGELIIEGNVHFVGIYKTNDGSIKKIAKAEHFSKTETLGNNYGNSVALSECKAEKVRGYAEAGNVLFNCSVNISTKIFSFAEKEIPLKIDEDFLRKKETEISTVDRVFTMPLRFSKNEKTEISPRLPECKEVLCTLIYPNIFEANIVANQLVFGGEILVQTVYSSLDEYEPLVEINDKFEFSQVVDIPNAPDSNNVFVKLFTENAVASLSQNEQGENRILDYTMDFCGYAYSCTEKNITLIDDMYSVKDKLTLEKETVNIKCEKLLQKSQGNKNIAVTLTDGKTPMSRINSVNISVGKIECMGNTVKIYGETSVNYQSSSGEIDGFNNTVLFELPIEKNSESNLYAEININDVQGILISGNELEIRISYGLNVYQATDCALKYVSGYEKLPENQMPEYGVIIYTVQKDDSLWDICKRYCVDESDIISINLDAESGVYAGQKIYIFRKIAV